MPDIFAKVFDNLNTGRISFYLVSGLPATSVLFLIANAILKSEKTSIRAAINEDLTLIGVNFVFFLFLAYIFGFIIAIIAFRYINDLSTNQDEEFSITNNFKLLCEGKVDYLNGILIPEYYRFVEASMYIPLGIVIGASIFPVYALLNILLRGDLWVDIFLVSLAVSLVLDLLFYWWYQTIVRRTVAVYDNAKRKIITQLKAAQSKEDKNSEDEITRVVYIYQSIHRANQN
jgi:phosphate/sulfate permease